MASSSFKYDIITLIELVESKPCLWDKTHDEYRNKILRDNGWREVCEYLEEGYEVLNKDEKNKTAQLIINKWNNIRDAFIRSLNVKSGQAAKKPYVFHENLKFLLKFTKKAETDANIVEETKQEHEVIAANDNEHSDNVTVYEPKKESSKNKRKIDPIEAAILTKIKQNKTVNYERVSTEDSFFTSFIPFVKDMSELEKIQLQMDILSSIQKIKQNRVLHQRVQSPYFLVNPAPGYSRTYPKHGHSIHSNSINSSSPILVTSPSPSPTSNSYADVPSPQSVD